MPVSKLLNRTDNQNWCIKYRPCTAMHARGKVHHLQIHGKNPQVPSQVPHIRVLQLALAILLLLQSWEGLGPHQLPQSQILAQLPQQLLQLLWRLVYGVLGSQGHSWQLSSAGAVADARSRVFWKLP